MKQSITIRMGAAALAVAAVLFPRAAQAHEIAVDFGAIMTQLEGEFGAPFGASADLDNTGHADASQANILEFIAILGDEDHAMFLDVHDAYHDNAAIVQDALALVDGGTISGASKDAFELLLGMFMTIQGAGGAIAGVSTTGMEGYVNSVWVQYSLTPAFDAAAWVQAEHFMEDEGGHEGEGEGESEVVLPEGETLSLTIPDPVEESLAIDWFKDDAPLSNGGRITGADGRTLEISALEAGDSGTYKAVYQSHAKHQLEYIVEVTVVTQIFDFGGGESLLLVIPPPIAQHHAVTWYKDGVELHDAPRVSGATTQTLQIANLSAHDSGVYEADYEGHDKHPGHFGPVYVTVAAQSRVVKTGLNFSVQIPAPIAESLPIEWYKDGVALSNGGRVSGADGRTLSITDVQTSDAGRYHAVYEEHTKHQASFDVLLRVVTEQVFTEAGGSLALTIPPPIEESLPIAWYRNGVPLANSARVMGADARTLIVGNLNVQDEGAYWAVYEEHAKHMATYGPVFVGVQPAGLPAAGGAGLAGLAGLLAAAGAWRATRRRR